MWCIKCLQTGYKQMPNMLLVLSAYNIRVESSQLNVFVMHSTYLKLNCLSNFTFALYSHASSYFRYQ